MKFDCEAAASMLDSGRVLIVASHAAAIIAAVSLPNAFNIAALVLWPVACYFALRVAVDASLFRAMASEPETAGDALDRFLIAHQLARKVESRDLATRINGALRLWRGLTIVIAVQIACVLIAKIRI